ncbi:MAG: hydrogenase maturation protease [Chloroflexi bacterium]|nr:hydrogenase maturation protease [Chloroflexota bacterium]
MTPPLPHSITPPLPHSITPSLPHVLVLALGNPLLGDDGVGWRVAEMLQLQLRATEMSAPFAISHSPSAIRHPPPAIEIDFACSGGLALMERLIGYERVLLIDAVQLDDEPIGSVRQLRLEDLPDPSAGHSASAHDTTLSNALAVGRALNAPLPTQVEVIAIQAARVYDFSETLSPVVDAAVPYAVSLAKEWCAQNTLSDATLRNGKNE